MHTDELPRITVEIRQAWHDAGLIDLAKKVNIGREADVLRLGALDPNGINVWQAGFSNDVEGFVTRSIELEGLNAPKRLHDYFRNFEFVLLSGRHKLLGCFRTTSSPGLIDADGIAEVYADLSIKPALVGAFANHVVDTLTQSMVAMRSRGGVRFQLEKTVFTFYSDDDFHWDHVQEAYNRKRKLSIPFTNPGKYFGLGYLDKERTRRREFVALAPGDVCVQAALTRYHGPTLKNGMEKTAFSLNFDLV